MLLETHLQLLEWSVLIEMVWQVLVPRLRAFE